eukprot:TCONS_00022015-protein
MMKTRSTKECNDDIEDEHEDEKEHSDVEDAIKPFQCAFCGKKFQFPNNLIAHSRFHTNGESTKANSTKMAPNNLIAHSRFHNNGESTKAKSAKFDNNENQPTSDETCQPRMINKEREKVSGSALSYSSGAKSQQKSITARSKRSTSQNTLKYVKEIQCNVCGNIFTRPDSLRRHRFIHSGDKSFSCKYCLKRFYRKDLLKDHIIVHTGEKPYECNVCGQVYAHRKTLGRHRRIHT